MGCSACGAPRVAMANNTSQMVSAKYRIQDVGECDYTEAMLVDFKKRLNWFKDKALYVKHGYKASAINKYIGIVGTSINIHNKCTYKKELDTISDLVDFIITLQNEQQY
jgi:hypothetical protein